MLCQYPQAKLLETIMITTSIVMTVFVLLLKLAHLHTTPTSRNQIGSLSPPVSENPVPGNVGDNRANDLSTALMFQLPFAVNAVMLIDIVLPSLYFNGQIFNNQSAIARLC